jgi:hypothetical protein
MLGVYPMDGQGGRETSYSILIIIYVFLSNVLLLNYLIAILSTTYTNMKQSGTFKYRKNLLFYCERFLLAFENEAYGEIVLHPPPLSYGCLILLPYLWNEKKMLKNSKKFSIAMFWIENVTGIFAFIIYELILVPFSYWKTALNLLQGSGSGTIRTLWECLIWFIIGIPFNIYLVYKDCSTLHKILKMYDGCKD